MDSILAQTYPADEIVLIEDGPLTEELYRAVAEYEELCKNNNCYPDLHIHAFTENRQLGRALAKGVELCRNELIARMDTDDIAMPDRLAKQTAYMDNHPEVSVAGGALREFNDEGTVDRVKQMPKTQEEIRQYCKLRNPLNHMTVIYRRSAILEAGNYQHFPYLEDYSLWSRMIAKDYQIRNLEDVLVRARTSVGLVKRRSGWAYFKNFRKLRKLQHELGLTGTLEYTKVLAGTFIVIMQPGWVKELAYKKVLRK
jgi:glycosyltransferase involved in cell wall biosynthesis